MRAPTKAKKSDVARGRIDISVGKFRWISYNGKRVTYELIVKKLGGRDNLIRFLKDNSSSHHSPQGFYGGNIAEFAGMVEPMFLLKLIFRDKAQLLKKNIRFFVTIGGSVTSDHNPDPRTHQVDYSANIGYKTREEANEAARSRFAYYNAWCRDDAGKKRTNVVTLKLFDKEGDLTEEKTN